VHSPYYSIVYYCIIRKTETDLTAVVSLIDVLLRIPCKFVASWVERTTSLLKTTTCSILDNIIIYCASSPKSPSYAFLTFPPYIWVIVDLESICGAYTFYSLLNLRPPQYSFSFRCYH